MITTVSLMPGEGMTFRKVSFQGSQLTAADRLQIAQREQVSRSLLLNRVLADHVEQALKALYARKEQGVKPEKNLVCGSTRKRYALSRRCVWKLNMPTWAHSPR